jgi:hypothetical protein
MARGVTAVVVLAVLTSACMTGSEGVTPAASSSTTTVVAATTTAVSARPGPCGPSPPVEATWVPEGWDRALAAGDGGHPEDPTVAPCQAHHWRGAELGRFINVIDGVSPYGIAPDSTSQIMVIGRPAMVGVIHEGYAVEFATYSPQRRYTLLGYGVTQDDLRRFAEGLVPHAVAQAMPEHTTAGVPDGLYHAWVSSISSSEVTVDFVGWYTGDAALQVATARGEEDIFDYYTVDDDHTKRDLPLSPRLVITSVWADYGSGGCEICPRPIELSRFGDLLDNPPESSPAANLAHSPYLITVTDDLVTRIDEQYRP